MWNYIRFGFVIVGIFLLFSDDASVKVYGLLLFFLGLISYVGKEVHLLSQENKNTREVNCKFEVTYEVKAILESSVVEKYFKDKNFSDYRKELDGVSISQHLRENYEKMLEEWKINPSVKVNVKWDDVYIDGVLSFENNIHHTIFIPFDLEDYDPDNYYVHAGVTIRAIMINGSLKIQVWYFSNNKMTNISTETLGSSEYHTYKSFYDLFSVPIMYSKPFLGLSQRHLNIVAEWIEGYYNSDRKMFSDDWKKKWQKLHTDLANYDYLNSLSDDWWSSDKRWMKILTEFWAIEKQYTSNDEDDWDYESRNAFWLNYISNYRNEFASIRISDLNTWYEENYKKYSSWIVKEEFIP